MTDSELAEFYRDYIACLNGQDWPASARFVHEDVTHDGKRQGIAVYHKMLEKDFDEISDSYFNVELVVA